MADAPGETRFVMVQTMYVSKTPSSAYLTHVRMFAVGGE